MAKFQKPERWTGHIRNWDFPNYVALHPCDIEKLLSSDAQAPSPTKADGVKS